MSTHKHIDKICVLVTVLTLIITLLFMKGKALGISVVINEEESDEMFTANDLNSEWSTSDASQIILSDDATAVKGNGAYYYNGDVYIVYAGKYVLTGELSEGSIIIDADGDDKIWLMLDGVSVNCSDDAAIRIEQADKVFMTLADGTENTLSSGSEYNADVISAGVDGTVYSRDDLTINGSGTLKVSAGYRHGIVCNDDLVITGGSIALESVKDGIHANDSVRIKDADISISAGDDGINVSNDDGTAYLYIESGKIDISSCYEGLEATDITIAGGEINITPTDDGINASGTGENSVIRITGGDITIINDSGRDADGLDSNGDIYISGGTVFISVSNDGGNYAIDYGSENGGVCEISGGRVLACGSSAMAEGFDSSSPQGFLMYYASGAAGTAVTLESADGYEIISEEIPCSFSSVVISTPELAVGDTCFITVGETGEEVTIDNSAGGSDPGGFTHGGGMRGGMGQNKMFGADGMRPDDAQSFDGNKKPNESLPDMQIPPDGQMFGGEQGGTPPKMPDGELPDETDERGTKPDFFEGNGRPGSLAISKCRAIKEIGMISRGLIPARRQNLMSRYRRRR